jgi:gentisate 1,2-dioxygenase
MPDSASPNPRPQSIADLPAQIPAAPGSDAESRARYFNTGNAFNVILPPVPDTAFSAEPDQALAPDAQTGLVACDASDVMQCDFPATSPFVLARYARINAGETLDVNFVASGVVHYVIQGAGTTTSGKETISWSPGDIFVTPGDSGQSHTAHDTDAVLWVVTNEPQLAFESLQGPAPGQAPTGVVHYPAAEIEKQVSLLYEVGRGDDIAGTALILSSDTQEASRNMLPTLTVAMNSLPPGVTQRPHRHNSVAVSLVIKGENCYSTIDGRKKHWSPWATTITPPVSVHSHTNAGDEQAWFLIVQDGGLFYHARAMGFEFVEENKEGA